MNLHQILEELAYDTGELPREAIESAISNKQEITPHLLKILEEVIARVDEVIEYDNYQGHLYAIYLLAQFHEKRALPLIVTILSLPDETPYALLGDVITEDLNRILASITLEDIEPLKCLIENPDVNEYVRAAALSSLVTLVGCGIKGRKEVLDYFTTLFHGKLERVPSFVWDALLFSCLELYPDEHILDMKQALEDQLVDKSLLTFAHIEKTLQTPKDDHLFALYQNGELIQDTVTEMEKWLTPQ